MNTTGIYNETTAETHKPRRWPWIVGIVAAFVIGTTIGAAGQTEPEVVTETRTVEVPAEPVTETVTETVEVEVIPQECKQLVESLRGYVDISMGALGAIAAILDEDGYLITEEYSEIMSGASALAELDPDQYASTACE
jgi:hypothetical protein